MAHPDTSLPAAATAPSAPGEVVAMLTLGLARFRRLMRLQGWEVDLARMCVDTGYACECLATAHTSSDERLREAALGLFRTYDRNRAPPRLH